MNVKRKNGGALNKTGFMRSKLLGRIGKTNPRFSTNSHAPLDIAPCFTNANTKKSVEEAHLDAERCRAEASRLRFNIA